MSIKARLALLLGLLLVAFIATLQILRQAERSRAEELAVQSTQANEVAVQRWISLLAQPIQRLGQDYSQWPELAGFIAQPDSVWAETNLRKPLAGYEAHALWLTDPQGRLVYHAQVREGPDLPLPLDPAGLADLASTPAPQHFFAESRDGLLEVWIHAVTPAGSQPHGWLLLAKAWSPRYLTTLSRLVEAQIQLGPPLLPAPARPANTQLRLPLADRHGVPLRQLVARFPSVDFAETLARDTIATNLFVAFGLLLVTAVWLGVRQWVLNPLDRITDSLAHEDTRFIQPLRREKNELGRVAGLVESSFAQKNALREQIEERNRAEAALHESELLVRRSLELRARLARDLHDGVIQSIYAAGLGLESALAQLPPDQPAVRIPLQQCRQSLNDIIREVRGFIIGLEPEQIPRQGFAQEMAALARTMQALWPVRILLDIDPALANQLNASQEVHALQIVRECVSNSLRHGEASEVRLSLAGRDGRGVLTVRDNGLGFSPTTLPPAKGHGLSNLAIRAREMGGSVQVQSEPGRGTVITLEFALPPAAT